MTLAQRRPGRLTDPCPRGRHGAGLRSGELAGKPVWERTRQQHSAFGIPRVNHLHLLRCLLMAFVIWNMSNRAFPKTGFGLSRWNMFSLWYVFALSSNADYCMSAPKRAWQRMPLLHSPWAKSLSFRGYAGGQLAEDDGRGSRPVTQVWFGIAPATVLIGVRLGPRESSFSRFPQRPRKPDSARSHTSCDSDTGSRRQVGTCPISVLEAPPASST
jgi:hypothetical protein